MKVAQLLLPLDLALVAYAQMTDHRIHGWLTGQLKQQKLSPVRFSGRHNAFDAQTLTTQEILDFDFEAESSGFVELKMFEIRSLNDADKIIMVTGREHDDTDEEELVQQAIEKLQTIADRDKSIAFDNVFINLDGMNATYQRWVRLAKYGGRIEFELDSVSDLLETEHHTSDRPDISIQAIWRYKWNKPEPQSTIRRFQPSTHNIQIGPPPMSWSLRVQHAIVDGENGVITLEDDINRRPPFMKAMAKYALHETLTRQGDLRQGQFGMSRIHDWGLDEPNDDPPYVGTRHFGEAPLAELPPPYSE